MIDILALDFDGVICDGLQEYFQSSKRTYEQIWTQEKPLSYELADSFYQLRPVIETGWEMPILLRALELNIPSPEILENWSQVCQKIITSEQLQPQDIAQKLDEVREQWIKTDLASWLGLHKFYPGVIPRLKQIINSGPKLYIITTKEGRFTQQLLQQQGIELPEDAIIGKEKNLPKYETLDQIIAKHQIKPANLWFVEDRLPALELVKKQPDLQELGLFLAAWGYNTEKTRKSLKTKRGIYLLYLKQFIREFSNWK
jgi:phosphoglycolate phosphatase-like HAD superfamily hydrolase